LRGAKSGRERRGGAAVGACNSVGLRVVGGWGVAWVT